MFGSATPLNTVRLVENLRALQDSIHRYESNSIPSPVITTVAAVQKQTDSQAAMK